MHRAEFGLQIRPSTVAIKRHRQSALSSLHPDHTGIVARRLRGVGLHHGVVLLMYPALGADVWRREQLLELRREIAIGFLKRDVRRLLAWKLRFPVANWAVIERRVIGQRFVGDLSDYFAV